MDIIFASWACFRTPDETRVYRMPAQQQDNRSVERASRSFVQVSARVDGRIVGPRQKRSSSSLVGVAGVDATAQAAYMSSIPLVASMKADAPPARLAGAPLAVD